MKCQEQQGGRKWILSRNTDSTSLLRIECPQVGPQKSSPMRSRLSPCQSTGEMSTRCSGSTLNHSSMFGAIKTSPNVVIIFSIWRTVLRNMQKFWLNHPSETIECLESILKTSCLNFWFGKLIARRSQWHGVDGSGRLPASDW